MTDPARCKRCGAPLTAGAGAECPRCLLAAGLADGTGGEAAPDAPLAEEIAKHFPHLEIEELLGQGGMGVVYKARHKGLDRHVALKVLPPESAREPGFAERFTREARTLARLQHPNIVGVHDFGESGGLFHLSMEYVDGTNLRQAMHDGKLSPREAMAIVPQVCDALQYAHDNGVVHRDIKPENILIDRAGRVKIADFGLAKLVRRAPVDVAITRAGQVMGTLHYMAPEQYKEPDSVDHRADIYSLGVVFYEMLTGELPLGTFPRPSEHTPMDARLDAVVLRALERERDRRWQHASDVKDRITAIVDGPAPPPAPVVPAATRAAAAAPVPRLSRLAVAGAMGLPAAFGVGALAWAIAESVTHLETEDLVCPIVGATAGGVVVLLALVLSAVAWLQIGRSGGRLTGLPWAVSGVVLNGLALCCGAPAVLITTPAVERRRDAPPAPHRFVEADVNAVALDARLVHGGRELSSAEDRAAIVRAINAVWAAMGPAFVRRTVGDRFGGSARVARDAANYRLHAIALEPDGRSGRAVFSTDWTALSVAVRRDGEAWVLLDDDWETRAGAADGDDEDGRLHR